MNAQIVETLGEIGALAEDLDRRAARAEAMLVQTVAERDFLLGQLRETLRQEVDAEARARMVAAIEVQLGVKP